MSTPLTVILPVYNSARYLEAALQSLRDQTVGGFVVHVWDDGSKDETPAILKRWINERLPGRVIGSQRVGIGNALARLVESSQTDLIARMDGDDLCDPDRFKKQLAFMNAHPEVAVLGTQMRRRDEATGKELGTTTHALEDADLRWQLRLNNPLNHPTVMMRRAAAIQAGNYQDVCPGQDDDLWLRLSQGCRMANLPDTLLTYREHDASITGSQKESTRVFRDRRSALADRVFPGLGLPDAQRLTHLLTHPNDLGVTRHDCRRLEQSAKALATDAGESPQYFIQTQAYREQRLNLRIRQIKSQPLLGRAWPMLRRAGQLALHMKVNRMEPTNVPTQGGAAWASRG